MFSLLLINLVQLIEIQAGDDTAEFSRCAAIFITSDPPPAFFLTNYCMCVCLHEHLDTSVFYSI